MKIYKLEVGVSLLIEMHKIMVQLDKNNQELDKLREIGMDSLRDGERYLELISENEGLRAQHAELQAELDKA